ncbi:MAG: LamG-like jellyroll fold domain-containing protein, partial [Candidatus Aenigmatarchaeota archaeon]
MKSSVGRISGIMISLVIAISFMMFLYQTQSVGAEDSGNTIYNQTITEALKVSERTGNLSSQIPQSISNIFDRIVSEVISISEMFNPGPNAQEQAKISTLVSYFYFDRRIDCHSCGQHNAPSSSEVNITISAVVSSDGVLADYYPIEWTVRNSGGGSFWNFNATHGKIEWGIDGDSTKWYVIESPYVEHPTKYYFFSEFAGEQSEPWLMMVSGPFSEQAPGETTHTPTSETSCSGGICQTTYYFAQTFYEKNGVWNRINTTLEKSGNGWKAEKNAFKTYVDGSSVSLLGDNSSASFSVPGSNPSVSGNVITYDLLNDQVNGTISLTLLPMGVEKMITLYSATLTSDFDYSETFNMDGSEFIISPLKIWYTSCSADSCQKFYYPAEWERQGDQLRLSISKVWLDSAIYPVYIDPTVYYNFTQSVTISKAYGRSTTPTHITDATAPTAVALSWANAWGYTVYNLSDTGYAGISAIDTNLANMTSGNSGRTVALFSNFSTGKTSSVVNWINATLRQACRDAGQGAAEMCQYLIANFTNTQWMSLGANLTSNATLTTRSVNYTGADAQKMMDSNGVITILSWGPEMESGEGCVIDFASVVVNYNSTLTFTSNASNNSYARPNDYVNFTMNASTNDDDLSGYIFSENFTSGDGSWRNSSWTALSGTQTTASMWNVSTATSLGKYSWKFCVNTSNNYVNCSDVQTFNFTNPNLNFTSPTNNNSNAKTNDQVNFTINITTGDTSISGYIFSSNFSDGTWRNSSWISASGISVIAWNTTTSTTAGIYAWRFYANASVSNFWNVSDIQAFNFTTKTLNVAWTSYNSNSVINDTTCTSGSPCSVSQYATFNASGNVTCKTTPAGQSCGSITGGLMYNNTSTTWAYVNTTADANPFYIPYGQNNSGIICENITNAGDTFTSKDIPDDTSGTDTRLLIQVWNTPNAVKRAWFKFYTNLTNMPTLIINATLYAYKTPNSGDAVGRTYNIYNTTDNTSMVNIPWNENQTTWNNQTSVDTLQSGTVARTGSHWMNWTIGQSINTSFSAGKNISLEIKDSVEDSETNYDSQLYSKENGASVPYLTVCYNYNYIANPSPLGTLSDGISYLLNYTVNATAASGFYNFTFNFSSDGNPNPPINRTNDAFMNIGAPSQQTKQLNITVYNSTGISDTAIKIYRSGSQVGSGNGNSSVNLNASENYTIEITKNVSMLNLTASIVNLNMTGDFNITSQIIPSYSGYKPSFIAAMTPVFALNNTSLTYAYVNITIPKNGVNVNRIMHCTNWNFSSANCSSWDVRILSYYNAVDTGDYIMFNATAFDGYGGGEGLPVVLQVSNATSSVNTSNLVGYWKFDEGVGTNAFDASGWNNSGTLTNATGSCTGTGCPSWTSGRFGQGLQFDGVGDYIDIGNPTSLNITNAITVEAWIYPINFSSSDGFIGIVDKTRGSTGNGGYILQINSDQKGDFMVGINATAFLEVATDVLSLNQWHHLVGTYYPGGNVSIYHNGVQYNGSSDQNNFSSNSNNIYIGLAGSGEYFNGTIDEVQVWNRSLSADEVRELYQSSAPYGTQTNFSLSEPNANDADVSYDFYRNGTVSAIWRFDEGQGAYAFDETGNNNTGSINGATWTTDCKYGSSCLSFDGTNDVVAAGNPTIANVFTVEAWAKVSDNSTRAIIGTRGPSENSFDMKFQNGDLIHGDIGNGASWITLSADASFSYQINTWYHVVYVVNTTG